MNRVAFSFSVPYPAVFKQRLLKWLMPFNCVAFYDSNNYKHDPYSTYDCIAACANDLVDLNDNPFSHVSQLAEEGNYLFGYFGYDLKNKIEKLYSEKPNHTGFPDVSFFAAEIIFELKSHQVVITASQNHEAIFQEISEIEIDESLPGVLNEIKIQNRITKEKYIKTVEALRKHIEEGDFYELNYCQEFFCDEAEINPHELFIKLNQKNASPFSAYLKYHDLHVISSSPERFLKRLGSTIISQPIKGTIKRDLNDSVNDELLKESLRTNEKEIAENVMIVDLVRNDLNRICKTASVEVREMFGVYTFPYVHHLISTIEGNLMSDITFEQILKATFPIGSMTGAPKVEVMKAIEFFEDTSRGVYSGCLGYVLPNGDFDFNVVIRTILYNATTNYLSFHAGGAITYDSDAEAEYEEGLLKANALINVLKN